MKGNDLENYPTEVCIGIKVHREIDYFTDKHPIVKEGTKRLWSSYRHYAGVIIDMFYDHLLAVNFESFSEKPLDKFSQESYLLLESNIDWLPAKAQNMLPYMIRGNWLLNYQHLGGIHRSLQGISRRTKFDVQLEKSVQWLQKDFELYQSEFLEFFPEAILHISNFREDLINSKL